MVKSISVMDNIERLEKIIQWYNKNQSFVNKLNDVLLYADIQTRETDPEVAANFLKVISENLNMIELNHLSGLYDSISKIAIDGYIPMIELLIKFLDQTPTKSRFYIVYYIEKLKMRIDEVKDLFAEDKNQFLNKNNMMYKIEKTFNYFCEERNVENNNYLDQICKEIFYTGVKIRDDTLHKMQEMRVKVEFDENID